MNKRNWRDLLMGVSMIALSMYLWFNSLYTIEIGILIGVMTLWWLLT